MPPSQAPEIIKPLDHTDPFKGLTRVETDITIQGTTSLHVEPHCCSLSWCVQPARTHSLDALRVLRPEDRVTISSPEGRVLFDGALTGVFYLHNPVHIYREIRGHRPPPTGFVIYWAPKEVDPYTWLSFFESDNCVTVHRHTTALIPREHGHSAATESQAA